jgi:hypothetical protein
MNFGGLPIMAGISIFVLEPQLSNLPSPMKFKKLFFTLSGVLALAGSPLIANAGSGKMVQPPSGPIAAPAPLFGAEVAVGYDTHYMFRGVNYGEDSVWGSLEISLPIIPGVDLAVGAWYQDPQSGSLQNPGREDELDLYTTIGTEVAPGIYGWVGYYAYLYPEAGGGSTNEITTGVEFSILNEMLTVSVEAFYDLDIEGWYFTPGVSHTLPINDFLAIEIGAAVGYQIDYNADGSDWNDVRAFVKTPISLTENVTLEPYIAHSWALDAIDSFQDDELFGGVSLSVSF